MWKLVIGFQKVSCVPEMCAESSSVLEKVKHCSEIALCFDWETGYNEDGPAVVVYDGVL